MNRRTMLKTSLAAGAALTTALAHADERKAKGAKTTFLHACMTLPYNKFPLQRALEGIKSAGYKHVAWGTSHTEEGGEQGRRTIHVGEDDEQRARHEDVAGQHHELARHARPEEHLRGPDVGRGGGCVATDDQPRAHEELGEDPGGDDREVPDARCPGEDRPSPVVPAHPNAARYPRGHPPGL